MSSIFPKCGPLYVSVTLHISGSALTDYNPRRSSWCCWRKTDDGRRVFESIHGWFLTTAQLQTCKMWKQCPGKISEYVQIRTSDCSVAGLQLRPHLIFILFFFFPWVRVVEMRSVMIINSLSEDLPLLHRSFSSYLTVRFPPIPYLQ